jgi:succinoglycan biosynthesis protein ExoO
MTASPPRISVIIPAYNAARYLPRAVDSALAQTGIAPPQIVIVNDASTDDTAAVIADLASRHPTVEGHANPANLGPAGTRNHAVAQARGDWIAVLDADDAFAPDRLARLIGAAEDAGLDAIADLPIHWDLAADCAAPEQLPATGTLDRLGLIDFLRPDPATGLDLGLLKPVFRQRLVQENLWHYPEGIRHGEDMALYVALVRAGVAFGLLREAHYLFSTRIGAVSGAYSPGSVTDVDYLAVAAQTRALRDQLAATAPLDPELAGLLDQRETDLARMNRIYGWTALRKGDWRRLRRWLTRDPGNRRALRRMVLAKLKGQRGLPD